MLEDRRGPESVAPGPPQGGMSVRRSLTLQCIVGLLLGFLVGVLIARVRPGWVGSSLDVADAAIRIWTNALRLLVSPLIVTQLFVAVAPHRAS
jgi:Na+/H+-dicarboxylate symporter